MTNLSKSLLLAAAALFIFTITLSAQKKVIKIVSTQQVESSQAETFNVLRDFNQFPNWSPFVITDPEQINNVTGEAGQIGSVFHWEGVAEKSEGTQTLVEAEGSEYLKMECNITKPFKSQPTFEYQINETEDGVEIVQSFELQCSRISYFMMNLFGATKDITEMNELGLTRLKTLLENDTELVSSK